MANGSNLETEALARELRKPHIVEVKGRPVIFTPDGYTVAIHEALLDQPTRKRGVASLHDAASFIKFVNQEGAIGSCNIYVQADYQKGLIEFDAVLNDHKGEEAQWRDYRARYQPTYSHEWEKWTAFNKKIFSQSDFASFIEENHKDIASVENMPTGAQVLQMAINFESKQEIVVKSAIRTQSGTVAFSYTNHEDGDTVQRMEMFKGFSLGVSPFRNGDGFRLDARLQYRTESQRLKFWYELVRPDLVLQRASETIIETVKTECAFPLLFGSV